MLKSLFNKYISTNKTIEKRIRNKIPKKTSMPSKLIFTPAALI